MFIYEVEIRKKKEEEEEKNDYINGAEAIA